MDSEFLKQKRNRIDEEDNNSIEIKEEEKINEYKEKEKDMEIKIVQKNTNKIETNILESNLNSNIPSNYPLNFSSNIRNEEIKQKEEKNQYPNLSPERRKYLKSLIDKLEISSHLEFSDKNISPEEKSRKTFRNGILHALVILNNFIFCYIIF